MHCAFLVYRRQRDDCEHRLAGQVRIRIERFDRRRIGERLNGFLQSRYVRDRHPLQLVPARFGRRVVRMKLEIVRQRIG